MYNLTNSTSAIDLFQLTKAVNDLSGSLYGILFEFIVFIAFFIFMKGYDTKTVFISASFITSVVAVGMFFLHLTNIYALIIPIILLLASVFIKIFGEEE